jgi:hypothetical protein
VNKFIAPLLAIDGYGQSAQNLFLAMKRKGFPIEFVAHDWRNGEFSKNELLDCITKEVNPDDTAILYHLPPTLKHYQNTKHLIAFTMWETDKLPKSWVDYLNHYCDEVFVPSFYCRNVFVSSGVKKPISIIPLGIDLDTYKYFDRPYREETTFLITGKMDIRKNYDMVIRAFQEEFTDPKEKVKLIIKSRKGADVEWNKDERITIIADDFTMEEMFDLYKSVDCFVYPTRGEGYGLPPREAMATGLPVILTNGGSLQEISNPMFSFPVGYELIKADYPNRDILGIEEDLGYWMEPNFGELKKQMREVYRFPERSKKVGKMASIQMRSFANPEIGANIIIDKLKQISKRGRGNVGSHPVGR